MSELSFSSQLQPSQTAGGAGGAPMTHAYSCSTLEYCLLNSRHAQRHTHTVRKKKTRASNYISYTPPHPYWSQAAVGLLLFPPEILPYSSQAWLLLSADVWQWFVIGSTQQNSRSKERLSLPLLLPSSSCTPLMTTHWHARSVLPSNQIFHYPSIFIIFSMTNDFPVEKTCHPHSYLYLHGAIAFFW